MPLVLTRRQMPRTFVLENWLASRAADRVVAVSSAVAAALRRRGTPGRKLSVIPNGLITSRVDRPVSDRALLDWKDRIGWDPGRRTIGIVARPKDQQVVLEALGRVRTPVRLVLAGVDPAGPLAARRSHRGFAACRGVPAVHRRRRAAVPAAGDRAPSLADGGLFPVAARGHGAGPAGDRLGGGRQSRPGAARERRPSGRAARSGGVGRGDRARPGRRAARRRPGWARPRDRARRPSASTARWNTPSRSTGRYARARSLAPAAPPR